MLGRGCLARLRGRLKQRRAAGPPLRVEPNHERMVWPFWERRRERCGVCLIHVKVALAIERRLEPPILQCTIEAYQRARTLEAVEYGALKW